MSRALAKDRTPRRRMSPEARRQEIIGAARPLFAERPLSQITLADVAEAAGCSRALVHSYFGGVPNLLFAVVAQGGAEQVEARIEKPPTPLKKRLDVNVPASLAVVEANREVWYAVMGHAHTSGNEQLDALQEQIREFNVERTLEVHSDLLTDTPTTRIALRALTALWVEVTRSYLDGHLTRPQAEAYIKAVNYAVVTSAIPAMEAAAPESAGAGDAG